ncbi:flagellar assembly protein FliW [Brevibacillus sp. SYP-B805]|uniref:flagellar assembly protein FliW n=1 Tax=Brevibacillus sp. SYP-B805 TaxID=1578199 RepID=UPI0013EA042D|nr:flagellar assembly protein FliW [Brevibacillus sp. SYP-B805]NGQ95632.1 flagellar assembly protein FliW [Brevibacillus sp. SYP-B805]
MTEPVDRLKPLKVFFEEGLPGFHEYHFFQLQQPEPGSPYFVLTSLDNPSIELGAIDPFHFFPSYEFTLSEYDKDRMRIGEESSIIIVNIVTLHPDGLVTVNLKAPVVINLENRMAKQIILNEEKYPIRQPLFTVQSKVAQE